MMPCFFCNFAALKLKSSKMKHLFRCFSLGLLLAFVAASAWGQTQKWREIHKVQKKETIFGIAKKYGLSIQELITANPEMNNPGYELKRGETLFIPYPKSEQPAVTVAAEKSEPAAKSQVKDKSTIRLGVMLPLHDNNGDGRRMVEYYRGVLLACDSLKKQGYSIDVHAWNTPEDKDITPILRNEAAKECDLIIGPLYSRQMPALSEFVERNDIRLVIPFSISAPELLTNRNIFQIYQSPNHFNESVIDQFMKQFKGHHPVFIDCNDSTSTKGSFTSGLRRRLDMQGIAYNLTNLTSSEQNFAKAFSKKLPNIVILNTGRSAELNVAIAKLNGLTTTNSDLKVTIFGYTEWMMYTRNHLENFYKYGVYIPATFHYNPLTTPTMRMEQKYRWNFHQDMMQSLPRFAIAGFDHTMFFLKGFKQQGRNFTGGAGSTGYQPIQTPLKFERIGNGGLRNNCLVFVHYLPEHRVETINF